METVKIINKEQLSDFHFSKVDVIQGAAQQKLRLTDLNHARVLGNVDHTKVKIIFVNELGNPTMVETTIWAVTEESICLKGALFIPIIAILQIAF
ncbi:hypothetical protein P872_05060 [Rhodonellum psychrophilum GCM71 = DSM 17998]|uniref:Uncharacterized protein n=2 Tax=Rhodonellum TaxID=336827 RepID=U5BQX7_9BACT|nr:MULTISPECIES: hypothetical protein [Rhodonellum]ERM82985.1 hypothetical protein P872_05060 [Rhodonellum psychrophilum GCM71 = DSM 17998]SDZ36272.1 hypothetical protein SAMN05444412_11194 [Rhodonellum ikkaensis]